MSDDFTIKLEHVSKKYCKNIKNSMVYGLIDIGRNLIGMSSHPDRLRKNEFWAVNDVSLEVKKGETLGIIGPNGSGKTTLLKMLNGIFWPDKGKITVKGKVGALIAVGAGFHNQLSGRENIYVNGAILGMSKKETDQKFDAIVDFADIGDFLDTPVKHYSSGMHVRLGFAIAVHSDSNILLVDEILAVGDINFQAKCMKKMKEIQKKGTTIIFISHNLNSVQLMCDKAIYINKGFIRNAGNTHDVLNDFKKDVLKEENDIVSESRYGTKELEIKGVEFLNDNTISTNSFRRGEQLKIKVRFEAKNVLEDPHFSIGFSNRDGVEVSVAITRDHGVNIDKVNGCGEITYLIDSLPLNVGKYWISVGCWDTTGHVAYDHHEKMYQIYVEDGAINDRIRERFGLVYIPAHWDVTNIVSQTKVLKS